MRVGWIAFALGVVVLQRQAALPGAVAWTVGTAVLAGCAALEHSCKSPVIAAFNGAESNSVITGDDVSAIGRCAAGC